MEGKIRKTAISLLAVVLMAWSLVLAADSELTIEAVRATYDKETSTTIFEGNVGLYSEDIQLSADRIELVMHDDGTGIVTATGAQIKFRVGKSDGEDQASGSADSAIVDYSDDVLQLIGNVTFAQGEAVVKTQKAWYNWTTKNLQTSQIANDNIDPSDNRTTIKIQIQN